MAETMRVEVAYVDGDCQFLREVMLPIGATVDEAITTCGIAEATGVDVAALDAGVWSKRAPRDRVLVEGDRVELYRPLRLDPMEARRARARGGR